MRFLSTLFIALFFLNASFVLGQSSYVVRSNQDITGVESLRDAIEFANSNSDLTTITFDFPDGVEPVIDLSGTLYINYPVHVNGPIGKIILLGHDVPLTVSTSSSYFTGFQFMAEAFGSSIENLNLKNFNSGFLVSGSNNVSFVGCEISGSATGINIEGNGNYISNCNILNNITGVQINRLVENFTAESNRFENNNTAFRTQGTLSTALFKENVITGHNDILSFMTGSNWLNVTVEANNMTENQDGFDVTYISAENLILRNNIFHNTERAAVRIRNSKGVIISGNIFTANYSGIEIENSEAVIKANLIGIDNTGVLIGNTDVGILCNGSTNNILIGGIDPSDANIIGGNKYGVHSWGTGVTIKGNYIGTNLNGDILGNSVEGCRISGDGNIIQGNTVANSGVGGIALFSSSNLIGGTLVNEWNIIRDNRYGVVVYEGNQNQIIGNKIYNNDRCIFLFNTEIIGNDLKTAPIISHIEVIGSEVKVFGSTEFPDDIIEIYKTDGYTKNAIEPIVRFKATGTEWSYSIPVEHYDATLQYPFTATATSTSGGVSPVTGLTVAANNTSEVSSYCSNTVVSNTNDAGLGSLRQAIFCANADPDYNIITFAIPTAQAVNGKYLIELGSPLPDIIYPALIEGTTQTGYAVKSPVVSVSGKGALMNAFRFINGSNYVTSSGVKGLEIFNFKFNPTVEGGIIAGGNDFVFEENLVNRIATDYSVAYADMHGILYVSGDNSLITENGFGVGAGYDEATTFANEGNAILVKGKTGTIGGLLESDGNYVTNHNNSYYGYRVIVNGESATGGFTFMHNILGREGESSSIFNPVYFQNYSNASVNSSAHHLLNNNKILSGRAGMNVLYGGENTEVAFNHMAREATGYYNLYLSDCFRTRIIGNYIESGMNLVRGSENIIGTSDANGANILYPKTGTGIYLSNSSHSNIIKNNYIGIDKNFNALPGGLNGIALELGAYNNIIGGLEPNEANYIYNISGNGIEADGDSKNNKIIGNFINKNIHGINISRSTGNEIKDNYIGTNVNGDDLGNSYNGINIFIKGTDNIIEGNHVSNNLNNGILIERESVRNKLTSNILKNNGVKGINLNLFQYPGNHSKAAPVLTTFDASSGQLILYGNTEFPDDIIEIFTSDGNPQNALVSIGSFQASSASWQFTVPAEYSGSQINYYLATSTSQTGGISSTTALTVDPNNTSELSNMITVSNCSLIVTSSADSGPGTLREAIECANSSSDFSEITFAVTDQPVNGKYLIELESPLPSIIYPTLINATTQAGYQIQTPAVVLSGKGALMNALQFKNSGLFVSGSGVKGLEITNFRFDRFVSDEEGGIIAAGNDFVFQENIVNTISTDYNMAYDDPFAILYINGDNSSVSKNGFGVGPGFDESVGYANNGNAILVIGKSGLIGGETEADGNIIKNHSKGFYGINVSVNGELTEGFLVHNNFLRITSLSTVLQFQNFTNGTVNSAAIHKILGNSIEGSFTGLIDLYYGGENTTIANNNLTEAAGAFSEPNGIYLNDCFRSTVYGNNVTGTIIIRSGSENTIGLADINGSNIIQSGSFSGISLQQTNYNIIKNNYIGVDRDLNALSIGTGIELYGSSNNIIGGTGENEANYFYNGRGAGIHIADNSNYNNVAGNFINRNNQGLYIRASNNNNIYENYIGTDKTGAELGNGWTGIYLVSANSNIIRRNTIANNTDANSFGIFATEGAKFNLFISNVLKNTGLSGIFLNLESTSYGNQHKLAPVITSYGTNATNQLTLSGTTEFADDTIEVFVSDGNPENALVSVGRFAATSTSWSFTVPAEHFNSSGANFYVATATSASGGTSAETGLAVGSKNTSELSNMIKVYPCNVVVNTLDAGEGSLRKAINCANANPDHTVITFDITNDGPHTIKLSTNLPNIIYPLTIDGTSQQGYDPLVKDPQIVVKSAGSPLYQGFRLNAGAAGSVIKGLNINTFQTFGIVVYGDDVTINDNIFHTFTDTRITAATGIAVVNSDRTTIKGNVFGTDLSGAVLKDAGDNQDNNVAVYLYTNTLNTTAVGAQIGGEGEGEANLIVNQDYPIILYGEPVKSVRISENCYENPTSQNISFYLGTENYGKPRPYVLDQDANSVSGKAQPHDIIEVFISSDGMDACPHIGTTVADGDGNWVLNKTAFSDPTIAISDATIFRATATDAGHRSTSRFSITCPDAEFTYTAGCPGTDIVFTSTTTGTLDDFAKQTWYVDGVKVDSTTGSATSTMTYNFPQAGTYEVKLQVLNGECISEKIVTYTSVNPTPVSAGEDKIICLGENTSLQASTGFVAYAWTPSQYLNDNSVINPVVSGLTKTTEFTVQATTTARCMVTDKVTVFVVDKEDATVKSFDLSDGSSIANTIFIQESDKKIYTVLRGSGVFVGRVDEASNSFDWIKKFDESVTPVATLTNNNEIVLGYGNNDRVKLVKVSETGEILLSKEITGSDYTLQSFRAFEVKELSDGSFVLLGQSNSDGVIFKLSDSFTVLWSKRFSRVSKTGTASITFSGVLEAANGDIYVAGGNQVPNTLVIRYTASGNLIWMNEYQDNDYGYRRLFHAGSDVIMVNHGVDRINVLKIDENGNKLKELSFQVDRVPAPMLYLTESSQALDGFFISGADGNKIFSLLIDSDLNLNHNFFKTYKTNQYSKVVFEESSSEIVYALSTGGDYKGLIYKLDYDGDGCEMGDNIPVKDITSVIAVNNAPVESENAFLAAGTDIAVAGADYGSVSLTDECNTACSCHKTVIISSSSGNALCLTSDSQASATLTATAPDNGSWSFSWTHDGASYASGSSITITEGGTYVVFGERNDGLCTGEGSFTVNEFETPNPYFLASNACQGQAVPLSNVTSPRPGYSYSWNFDGATLTGPSPSYSFSSPGYKNITLTISNGTSGTALGQDLVQNGDFTTPISTEQTACFNTTYYYIPGWMQGGTTCLLQSVSGTEEVVDGQLLFDGHITTTEILTEGKKYRLQFDIVEMAADHSIDVQIHPYGAPMVELASFSSVGTHTLEFESAGNRLSFSTVRPASGGSTFKIDNVKIQEIYENVSGVCSASYSQQVEIYENPVITLTGTKPVSCSGNSDGEATFTFTGGYGSYDYLVDGEYVAMASSGSPVTITGLTAGTHIVKVMDRVMYRRGCDATYTFTIGDGSPSIASTCVSSVSCNPEDASGTIDIIATRPSPYTGTYSLQVQLNGGTVVTASGTFNDQTPVVVEGLSAGTYTISLTPNENVCTSPVTRAVTISRPGYSATLDNDEHGDHLYYTCGSSADQAEVVVRGNTGVTPCTQGKNISGYVFSLYYNESNELIETVNSAENLATFNPAPGTYRVEFSFLMDGVPSGCTASVPFEVMPSTMQIGSLAVTDETCREEGTAAIQVSGGVEPITYEWKAGDVTLPYIGHSVVDLAAGDYTVKAVDARGCVIEEPFTVLPADESMTVDLQMDNTACDATATVTSSSNTAPYTFSWSRERAVRTVTASGVDADGDIIYNESFITVTENAFTDVSQDNISSPGQNNPAISLQPGWYTVTVTDANGCTIISERKELTEPAAERNYALCIRWKTYAGEDTETDPEPPTTQLTSIQTTMMVRTLEQQVAECVNENAVSAFAGYTSFCRDPSSLEDTLHLDYELNYHHYTLYYYDRTGSLVRTVAPKGVDISATDRTPVSLRHNFVTEYDYNSLGQLERHESPDEGETVFLYDNLSRLRFSQSEKQKDGDLVENPDGLFRFSYNKYDLLGRTIEIGEAKTDQPFSSLNLFVDDISYPTENTNQEIYTVYNSKANWISYFGQGQKFLRNRISYSWTKNLNGEKSFTYYSYDPHGKVNWIIQDVPGLGKNYLSYKYDLISGNVIEVKYNERLIDKFFHKYFYDEDNRLKRVETSKDGEVWDWDGRYNYYTHGPIRNLIIGDDNLQKIDYTYTIHGWLKAINTPSLGHSNTEGPDKKYLQDEFGMVLSYYDNDFRRTGSELSNSSSISLNNNKQLFNGNLSSWVWRINEEYKQNYLPSAPDQISEYNRFTTGFNFTYDRLNRLKKADYYIYNGNTFNLSDNYFAMFNYDANGNIISLKRSGPLGDMDLLTYQYDVNGSEMSNKLLQVSDAIAYANPEDDPYTGDIESQGNLNYSYDKAGNLRKDISEGLDEIKWNNFGKIAEIIPVFSDNLEQQKPWIKFVYDPAGNRVKKEVNKVPFDLNGQPQKLPENVVTTYYIRDATGNVMAIYERKNESISEYPLFYKASYRLVDNEIYGTERLGQYLPGLNVSSKIFHESEIDNVAIDRDVFQRNSEFVNQLIVGINESQLVMMDGNENITYDIYNSEVSNLKYDSPDQFERILINSYFAEIDQAAAVAESKDGVLEFYALAATSYWGRENVILLKDAEGNLIPGAENITLDATAEPAVMKRPGDDYTWYLFTKGLDGKLYYHTILKNEDNQYNVTSSMRELDATAGDNDTYGNKFQVVEDYSSLTSVLYATRYNSDNRELVAFIITEEGAVIQSPIVLKEFVSDEENGDGEFEISPNGESLSFLHLKERLGWFDSYTADHVVLNLGHDHLLAEKEGVVESTVHKIEFGTSSHSSLCFDETSSMLFFTSIGLGGIEDGQGNIHTKFLKSINLKNATVSALSSNFSGGLIRLKDNYVYSNSADYSTLQPFHINDYGTISTPVSDAIEINLNYSITFPSPNHKIYQPIIEGESSHLRIVNNKLFELKDHLHNVRATISDSRNVDILIGLGSNYTNVLSYSNYYPFGMELPSRSFSSDSYRYGFNGKEKDDEIKGPANCIAFENRIYDPRLARFLSVDPWDYKYPYQSPYVFARNNPVALIDYLGLGDGPILNWLYFKGRHLLSGDFKARSSAPSGGITTVVVNPAWQSKAQIEAFFNEAIAIAQKMGKTQTDVTLSNGTTWNINVKDGHFVPIKGEGIANLSQMEIGILRAAKSNASGETIFERMKLNKSLKGVKFSENMQLAIKSLAEIEGVSTANALSHINEFMPEAEVLPEQANAAKSRFGSAAKYIKWGGRALLVVAVAHDVYEVYNSENKARTITKKVGGWTGAITAGSATGAALTATGIDFAGPWGWAAHGVITLGAGVGGYFAGEYVTETVYDWIFTPVK